MHVILQHFSQKNCKKSTLIAIIATMNLFISLLFFLFFPRLEAEEFESGFAKNPLFSVFGYNPLMSGEEKELRNLHGHAESHVRKKEYLQAEKSYEEILSRIDPPFLSTSKYKIDWTTYVDLVIRLSESKFALKEYKEGEKLLLNLIATHPPQDYLPALYFLLARFYAIQNDPGASFVQMHEVKAFLPIEKWRGEDRSFFHGIEYLLNDHFDKLLKKAKRFALAHENKHALKMYEEIQSAIQIGHYPRAQTDTLIVKKVRYKLAELYYQEACFEKTLSLVETRTKPQDKIDCEMLYLAASAYKEKREYEKAIECFQGYLEGGAPADPEHLSHALFEIGLSQYRASNFSKAKESFEKIADTKGKIHSLAHIYLSRIHLKEGNAAHAVELLNALSPLLQKDDPLKYEVSFLKGEAYYQMGELSFAIEFFETASGNQHKEWSDHALYKLGLCYLKLSEKESKFGQMAEKIFASLLSKSPNEALILAQAKLYQVQHQDQKIEKLIEEMSSYFSREGEAEALLILAETKKDPAEKERLYSLATSERFSSCSLYPECWYRRGVNDFKAGNYTESIDSFEKAFSFFEKCDQKMASHLLQCEAAANFYRNLPLPALTQLETLLNAFPGDVEEKEEVLYLQGLVSSHLASQEQLPQTEREQYGLIAENSLQQVRGKWKEQSLFALGSLFYRQKKYSQAEEKYKELEKGSGNSPIAAHALYWCAETAEKMNRDPAFVLSCRKKCYERYPFSLPAPGAYFKCYPFEKYLEGDPEAVAHVKVFPSLFPSSPLVTLAYYFTAHHEHDPNAARSIYEKALLAYDNTSHQAKENKTLLLYFRNRSLLETAILLTKEEAPLADLQKIISLLEKSIEELKINEALLSCLHEESQFVLAKCYLQTDQEKKAEEILLHMLSTYREQGIAEGYYLSSVLIEQGKLALLHDDVKAAYACLEMAEVCGMNHLPPDEKLSLWLYQSECFKRENRLDAAMRMLSRVINEDVSSRLREKAMFLRAEIYELEGRHELAVRQLEATAKRGGLWGKKAKERLKDEYGME